MPTFETFARAVNDFFQTRRAIQYADGLIARQNEQWFQSWLVLIAEQLGIPWDIQVPYLPKRGKLDLKVEVEEGCVPIEIKNLLIGLQCATNWRFAGYQNDPTLNHVRDAIRLGRNWSASSFKRICLVFAYGTLLAEEIGNLHHVEFLSHTKEAIAHEGVRAENLERFQVINDSLAIFWIEVSPVEAP